MSILEWISPTGMLAGFVNKVLTGPLLQAGVQAYKEKLAKDNNVDHVLADIAAKEIALRGQQAELDDRQLQREQGRWWTAAPRAIVCWSIAIYVFKVVVWDIVMGLGITPPLKDPLIVDAFGKIIVMWFGGRTLEKMTSIVVSRIK